MNNQRLAQKIDNNQSTLNNLIDELVDEIELLEKENEALQLEIFDLKLKNEDY